MASPFVDGDRSWAEQTLQAGREGMDEKYLYIEGSKRAPRKKVLAGQESRIWVEVATVSSSLLGVVNAPSNNTK